MTGARRRVLVCEKAGGKKRSDREILPLGKREKRGQMLTSVWAAARKAAEMCERKELDYPRQF